MASRKPSSGKKHPNKFIVLVFATLALACIALTHTLVHASTNESAEQNPVPLWPSAPDEPTHRVIISTDYYHSMIGLWPESDPDGLDDTQLEEWGYANKAYYLYGDDGVFGTLRALFVDSPAVVHVVRAGAPFSTRSTQPPVNQFSFRLSHQSWLALREHLEDQLASTTVIQRTVNTLWYDATVPYTMFYNCHDFTADALRAAGIPVETTAIVFTRNLDRELARLSALDTRASAK